MKWITIIALAIAVALCGHSLADVGDNIPDAVCRTSDTITGCTTLALTTEWQEVETDITIQFLCLQNWEAAGGGRVDISLDGTTVWLSIQAGASVCDDKMFVATAGFDTVYLRGESGGEGYQMSVRGVAR